MKTDTGPEVMLSLRIPKTLRHRLRVHCAEADVPMAAFLIAAVIELLRQEEQTGDST